MLKLTPQLGEEELLYLFHLIPKFSIEISIGIKSGRVVEGVDKMESFVISVAVKQCRINILGAEREQKPECTITFWFR